MYSLTQEQVANVAGAGEAEVDTRIGQAIGTAIHCLASTEAAIGSVFGVVGAITGAVIHYANNHGGGG